MPETRSAADIIDDLFRDGFVQSYEYSVPDDDGTGETVTSAWRSPAGQIQYSHDHVTHDPAAQVEPFNERH